MDVIQTLFDRWDPGEVENYPGDGRIPASEEEVAAFESLHDVALPDLAKQFYYRVNGMTEAEWERDVNHFFVKFFPLKRVFAIAAPASDRPGDPPEGQFFAIASVGHLDPGPDGYPLVYGLELFHRRVASNRVIGIYPKRQSRFEIASSFGEFLTIASTNLAIDAILDPEWARHMEALQADAVPSPAPRERKWWPIRFR
jgi:hypothetical protein